MFLCKKRAQLSIEVHICPNSHEVLSLEGRNPKYCSECGAILLNEGDQSAINCASNGLSSRSYRDPDSRKNDQPIKPNPPFSFIVFVEEPSEQLLSLFKVKPDRIDESLLDQLRTHTMWYSEPRNYETLKAMRLDAKYNATQIQDGTHGLAFIVHNVPNEYQEIFSTSLRTSIWQMWRALAQLDSESKLSRACITSIQILNDEGLSFIRI